jgi:hypothetical protein
MPRVLTDRGDVVNPPYPPPYPPQPTTKQMSDIAARAAQHVFDLEEANERLVRELAETKNHFHLSEERNKELSADLRSVRLEMEFYQRRFIEVQTKLKTAGSIILDAMKEPADSRGVVTIAEALASRKSDIEEIESDHK